jgi:hypothetical protein
MGANLSEAWASTAGTIAERIAQIRAHTVQTPRPIPAREVKRMWGQRMVLAAAYEASRDPDVAKPLRILCRATYDNLMGDLFGDLDPADPTQAPTITAFLNGLQAAGVLSDEVRAETMALAQIADFPFQDIGLPDLHKAGLISAADAGVGE